jgi:hypothetical protein
LRKTASVACLNAVAFCFKSAGTAADSAASKSFVALCSLFNSNSRIPWVVAFGAAALSSTTTMMGFFAVRAVSAWMSAGSNDSTVEMMTLASASERCSSVGVKGVRSTVPCLIANVNAREVLKMRWVCEMFAPVTGNEDTASSYALTSLAMVRTSVSVWRGVAARVAQINEARARKEVAILTILVGVNGVGESF